MPRKITPIDGAELRAQAQGSLIPLEQTPVAEQQVMEL